MLYKLYFPHRGWEDPVIRGSEEKSGWKVLDLILNVSEDGEAYRSSHVKERAALNKGNKERNGCQHNQYESSSEASHSVLNEHTCIDIS